MKRSDAIAIYRDGNRNRCRLCCSDIVYDSPFRLDICRLSKPHVCCNYGSVHSHRWTENFYFNNSKHIIVLSTNFCSLC